jgi:TRAP-type mannitol/chloroaromatic compound transport system permease small subunit
MVRQQRLGHKLGGALGIPIWVVTIAVILSFTLIILFGITSFLRKILQVHQIKGEAE